MADAPRIAVRWVEDLGPRYQPVQLTPEGPQLGDPTAEFCGPAAQQVEHVAAGRLALVPKGDDAADLTQREPDRLGGPDEGEAIERGWLVVPVPRPQP